MFGCVVGLLVSWLMARGWPLAKTTPADPLYAQLQAEQARAPSLWQEGRSKFRQEVRSILTPAQQTKFDQLRAQQAAAAAPAESPR